MISDMKISNSKRWKEYKIYSHIFTDTLKYKNGGTIEWKLVECYKVIEKDISFFYLLECISSFYILRMFIVLFLPRWSYR